jgi:sec-independent protein translocase protein TatB
VDLATDRAGGAARPGRFDAADLVSNSSRLPPVFNFSGSEIVFLLLIALIVLGPEKLPEAVRKFGKTYGEFKKMTTGFQSELKSALDEPMREMRETADAFKKAASFDFDAEPDKPAEPDDKPVTRMADATPSGAAPSGAAPPLQPVAAPPVDVPPADVPPVDVPLDDAPAETPAATGLAAVVVRDAPVGGKAPLRPASFPLVTDEVAVEQPIVPAEVRRPPAKRSTASFRKAVQRPIQMIEDEPIEAVRADDAGHDDAGREDARADDVGGSAPA